MPRRRRKNRFGAVRACPGALSLAAPALPAAAPLLRLGRARRLRRDDAGVGARLLAVFGLSAALTLGAALAASPAEATRGFPPRPLLNSGGETTKAWYGSFCVYRPSPACRDIVELPKPRNRLPLVPGGFLRIDTRWAVHRIGFALLHRRGERLRETGISAGRFRRRAGRRWRFRLPRDLDGANTIYLAVAYARDHGGGGDFWSGACVRRCD